MGEGSSSCWTGWLGWLRRAFAGQAAPLPCVFPPPSQLMQRLCPRVRPEEDALLRHQRDDETLSNLPTMSSLWCHQGARIRPAAPLPHGPTGGQQRCEKKNAALSSHPSCPARILPPPSISSCSHPPPHSSLPPPAPPWAAIAIPVQVLRSDLVVGAHGIEEKRSRAPPPPQEEKRRAASVVFSRFLRPIAVDYVAT